MYIYTGKLKWSLHKGKRNGQYCHPVVTCVTDYDNSEKRWQKSEETFNLKWLFYAKEMKMTSKTETVFFEHGRCNKLISDYTNCLVGRITTKCMSMSICHRRIKIENTLKFPHMKSCKYHCHWSRFCLKTTHNNWSVPYCLETLFAGLGFAINCSAAVLQSHCLQFSINSLSKPGLRTFSISYKTFSHQLDNINMH